METRTIAMLALVLVVVAIVALGVHIAVPTPPAHQPNRAWDAWRRVSSSSPQATLDASAQAAAT